jgi:hypothetical protein
MTVLGSGRALHSRLSWLMPSACNLAILDAVLADGGSAIATLWNSTVGPAMILGAQVTELIGIDLLRAIIRFLSHVELGWDIAIWGTLTLPENFPAIPVISILLRRER